jgi:NAD(P)-dependent dehydrogenase (short-subunit alcohol dehydrogenase family)
MSKILVTGCAGLIGSHVVELLLDKGYDVIGVDDLSYGSNMMNHPKFKFVESKVQSFSNDNELDAVFHLATLKKPFNGVKCNSSDVMLQWLKILNPYVNPLEHFSYSVVHRMYIQTQVHLKKPID